MRRCCWATGNHYLGGGQLTRSGRSMDFVIDRTAEGCVLKALTIVDDATHKAVAVEVERAISGHGVARVMDRLALTRGLPQVIRTDSGKKFCGRAMVA